MQQISKRDSVIVVVTLLAQHSSVDGSDFLSCLGRPA